MDMIFFSLFVVMLPMYGLFWLGVRNERAQMARERQKQAALAIWTKSSRRRRILQ